MDQNEKQLEKKLRDRIEANYRSYIQQLQSRPAPDLIEQAAEIASVKLVYDELMDCCNPGDAEYLLRFENPLRLVSDQWLAEQNVSHSDELGHENETYFRGSVCGSHPDLPLWNDRVCCGKRRCGGSRGRHLENSVTADKDCCQQRGIPSNRPDSGRVFLRQIRHGLFRL